MRSELFFIWTNLNPLHPRRHCAKVEIGPVVLEKIFKFLQCIFAILYWSPLGKRWNPSFEQIWIPFTRECFVPSWIEIGPVVLEKIFLNFINVFSLFRNYLPLQKGGTLHLNNLESILPKDALYKVWLKLA